jgi:hypothetical protein
VQGQPVDEAVVSQFRASYLFTKNAAKSAREVGIPERTGRKLALELVNDPEFAEACRRQRALDVEEHAEARRRVRDVALRRFLSKTGGIDVKALGQDGPVVITDRRHEYGKLVLDADKNAQSLAKIDADNAPTEVEPLEVVVRLAGEDDEKKPPEGG